MKRREFLKSTLLFAAVSSVVGKASGVFSNAMAADVPVTPGKLGYKDPSPQAKNGKQCGTCKHFDAKVSACTLAAMRTAMKVTKKEDHAIVKDTAYCNMWAKKA